MSETHRARFGSAIILAGGKSRRMGFDKQALQMKNRRLVLHHGRVLTELFGQIVVVTHSPELYRDTPFTLVADAFHEMGPLAGLHAGLQAVRSRYAYLLACDMPFINLAFIRYMQQSLGDRDAQACVTRFGTHLEPFNAFYARRLAGHVEACLTAGNSSVYKFLRQVDTLYIPEAEARRFSPDWSMFANLNTRQDYEAWRRRVPDLGVVPHADIPAGEERS